MMRAVRGFNLFLSSYTGIALLETDMLNESEQERLAAIHAIVASKDFPGLWRPLTVEALQKLFPDSKWRAGVDEDGSTKITGAFPSAVLGGETAVLYVSAYYDNTVIYRIDVNSYLFDSSASADVWNRVAIVVDKLLPFWPNLEGILTEQSSGEPGPYNSTPDIYHEDVRTLAIDYHLVTDAQTLSISIYIPHDGAYVMPGRLDSGAMSATDLAVPLSSESQSTQTDSAPQGAAEGWIPYKMNDLGTTIMIDPRWEITSEDSASVKFHTQGAAGQNVHIEIDGGDDLPMASRFPTNEEFVAYAKETVQQTADQEICDYGAVMEGEGLGRVQVAGTPIQRNKDCRCARQ